MKEGRKEGKWSAVWFWILVCFVVGICARLLRLEEKWYSSKHQNVGEEIITWNTVSIECLIDSKTDIFSS